MQFYLHMQRGDCWVLRAQSCPKTTGNWKIIICSPNNAISGTSPWCKHQEDHQVHWSIDWYLPPSQVRSLGLLLAYTFLLQHLLVRLATLATPTIYWLEWKAFQYQILPVLLPTWLIEWDFFCWKFIVSILLFLVSSHESDWFAIKLSHCSFHTRSKKTMAVWKRKSRNL